MKHLIKTIVWWIILLTTIDTLYSTPVSLVKCIFILFATFLLASFMAKE